MADADTRPTDLHPGMMGDGTEEQNLGQEGDPSARITEDEVKSAFDDGEGPHSRPVEPLPEVGKHDQLGERPNAPDNRQEALIDESLEESFPASDPPSAKHIT
jgi:hypothetical protein